MDWTDQAESFAFRANGIFRIGYIAALPITTPTTNMSRAFIAHLSRDAEGCLGFQNS